MEVDNKTIAKYLTEVRRVNESRSKDAEKEIRKLYKGLLKELNSFIGEYYTKYSNDEGILNAAILQQNAKYAAFLEEVDKNINEITPEVSKLIKKTVEDTYKICYKGMVNAFSQAVDSEKLKESFKGLSIKPDVMKAAVQNPIGGLTLPERLKKNRQEVVYDIKQNISNALMTGERYDTTAKKIAERLDINYGKAIRIVRTESHRVQEKGLMEGAEEIGDNIYDDGLIYAAIWRNMGDSRVRPYSRVHTSKGWKTVKSKTHANHVKMEGQIIEAGGYFDLGDGVKAKSPGESGDAANDINCRCYVEYEVIRTEEFVERGGKLKERVSDNERLGISTPNNDTQNYKPVNVDKDDQNTFRRRGENITVSRLINMKNKVYISSEAKIKPKQQQELDRNITAVLDMLNVKDKSIQPIVAILSDNEMANNAVASYSPVQNVVYVRQALLDYEKLYRLQEEMACPNNKYSTILHEYIHWLDAEEYRSKNGNMDNEETYKRYIKELRGKSKIRLDGLEKQGYNIFKISKYASRKYSEEEYDEAYTEYRVKQILRG